MKKENKTSDNFFVRIFRKFSQFCFLSIKNANENMIWESASACAFGFIFSFIPVVLIILTVLVTILKLSPEILSYVIDFANQFKSFYDFTPLINALLKMKSISFIEIFLAVWVIWMARKLFYSVVSGINRIFRSVSKRLSVVNQMFSIVSEFVVVLIFILVILFSFLFNKLNQLPFFKFLNKSFPILFSAGSNRLIISVTYFLFFIFSVYSYKILSGAKPRWRTCIFYAAISTGVTFVISFFINKFMRITNYNIVYGAISTLVILLFKVYLFFAVFMFCAQMLYVSEFFENLLICELYYAQTVKKNQMNILFYEKMFKNPVFSDFFITKRFTNQQKIYSQNDEAKFVFYLKKGIILDVQENHCNTYRTGDFFGESSIILSENRKSKAIAVGECEVSYIPKKIFQKILADYPKLGKIALQKI